MRDNSGVLVIQGAVDQDDWTIEMVRKSYLIAITTTEVALLILNRNIMNSYIYI